MQGEEMAHDQAHHPCPFRTRKCLQAFVSWPAKTAGAKLGSLDSIRQGSSDFTVPSLLWVPPPPPSCLEGSFLAILWIFESWNHFAGWILPYLGKEVLCSLNEVHREGRQAKCLPKALFVHQQDLVVLSFVSVCIFLFQVNTEHGDKPVPSSMASESSQPAMVETISTHGGANILQNVCHICF